MRFKVTYQRAGGPSVDLAITADATATVGDVARALAAGDPTGGDLPAKPTLGVRTGGQPAVELNPTAPILDSGLQSGVVVEVVPAGALAANSEAVGAILRVVSGPDAGTEFPLAFGSNVVGRAREANVRLSDPLISKRHLRVNLADAVEVLDLGSANGVTVGGDPVSRTTLRPGDEVVAGDTTFVVAFRPRMASTTGNVTVDVIRSPRVVPLFPGVTIPVPSPPRLIPPQRFPYLAIIAPLLMGAVLFAVTHQLLGVIMMALSPVLAVGAWLDGTWVASRSRKAQDQQFTKSMAAFRKAMAGRQRDERGVRVEEAPSLQDLVDSALAGSALLWTRRPEHDAFLTARMGLATLPSRDVVELPSTNDTDPTYWAQLEQARDDYALVADVPLVAEFRVDGSIGIAGDSEARVPVARALALQILGLHSPAEVVCAAIVPTDIRPEWEWLEWMPHTAAPDSPLGAEHLAETAGRASAILARISELIDSRLGDAVPEARGTLDPGRPEDLKRPVVPAVVLFIDAGAPVDRARATRIAERGPDAQVHVVWCERTVEQLPAACRMFVDVTSRDGTLAGRVRRGDLIAPVTVESIDAVTANAVARSLAAAVDAGVPGSDESDLPRSVSFVELAGHDVVEGAEATIERWKESDSITRRDGEPPVRRKKASSLRAVIGHAGSEPFLLDLKTHGPHALVGGTTGSGKSEFLQSWVLGMATAHSPDRVTFLFVDYKGGSAFADCVDLPHTVGLVTDLSPHLVRRALTSLRAELRYREHLLHGKGAKDLATLERSGDPDAPPSLVIVVDEFAALAQEVPEFVDGVVDVAQRGRSLGLHLILATQRPAGVIKDNLRANTNLRVALRMADAEDSNDVLGDPMAAHFDPAIPGRGVAKTGPGRLTPFQAAYAGGHTGSEPPPPRIEIEQVRFGAVTPWDVPDVPGGSDESGAPDIARIVASVAKASQQAQIPLPRKPWLPELAATYDVAKLPNPRTDEKLLLGVVDDPAAQAQPTVFYEPDAVGNLALFGTGGAGKSTALRSIAVSAAFTTRGGPVQVYGLDFGSGGLRMLGDLPHVGAIIGGDDDERIVRLLRTLRATVDDRATRYSALAAGTIVEYRRAANLPDEPRILLMVDGMSAFRDAYEFSAQASVFAAFSQIAVDGRQVGVHVILTGDRPNSLPSSISSTFQQRIVLRTASDDDYIMLGVPKDVLSAASPPGRAILGSNEMQFAVLGGHSTMALQSREITRLAEAMRRQGIAPAADIPRLATMIPLDDLPAQIDGLPVVGVLDATLGAAGFEPSGSFMIAGSPQSGRSSALAAVGRALKRDPRGVHVAVFSPRRSAVVRRGGWDDAVESPEQAVGLAATLLKHIESGKLAAGQLAILIESAAEFAGTDAEGPLADLVRAALRADQFAVAESESSTWSQLYGLGQPFKAGKRGLVLAPTDMDGDLLFSTPLGRVRRADFPAGRGFLIDAGRARKVHIAWVE